MITVPLRDIPGYTPDGPVNVIAAGPLYGERVVMHGVDIDSDAVLVLRAGKGCTPTWCAPSDLSLILDATGAASLARAVAASRGLNPGRGLQWWIDDADRSLGMQGDVTAWFVPCAGIAAFETVVPALADITPDDPGAPLLALAAVARVVLGATTEATP